MTAPPIARPATADLTTGRVSGAAPVAVSPHHLATRAAIDVMEAGGSAVDGALAANAVLGVVAPDTCGIGGDLFALVHSKGDPAPSALNASGRAGSGASAAALRAEGHSTMPLRHPATVTVPGCVDGWEALQARFGNLSLGDVLAPAIDVAEEGFAVSLELADSLQRIEALIGDQQSSAPLYPEGRPPTPGEVLRRSGLAATLRDIAQDGRAAFYEGRVAAAISEATGGILTGADLARVQADWVDPLSVEVFGATGWTVPPNSQGYLTLAAAAVLEELDPPPDVKTPAFVHACIEAYRSVAWEREDVVTDPKRAPHNPEWYLDRSRLAERAQQIRLGTVTRWPSATRGAGGTAYLCTVDGDGMSVSFIQSNFHGIGSSLSAGDSGVFLHNRGAGFSLDEGHPNEWSPGHRPLHTLSPTLWTSGKRCRLVLGTRGGSFQPQLLLQALANLYVADLSGTAAQVAPRWEVEGFTAGAEPTIRLEHGFSEGMAEGLRDIGYEVEIADGVQAGWGPISFIEQTKGTRAGFADPRVTTSAAHSGS